jgi:hypothetical protein
MDHGAWLYRKHVKPADQEVLDWEVRTLNFVLSQCFD